ncbi:methyl-accepting chemotaxis protein [Rhodoferax sp.]|uniref:methyl-accepting chemotaxis protein n=1 Tax=Rhodoferax sp. TaxID=50421 RepID=UPI0025E0F003|nr:methyl-accepting chemotaxis protein [Rhodoferax sp.]
MKLRTQIIGFGLAGTLLAAWTGGIGLYASSRMGGALDDAIQASVALQTSQEADMMHDAVRGDAQLAILGAMEKNPAQITEADKDLKEHAETFNKALTELQAMPLTSESTAALSKVRPLVQKYIASAALVVSASGSDVQAAQAAVPALQGAFSELEKEMEGLSDTIQRNGAALNAQAKQHVETTRITIGASLVLACVVMMASALWLARSMTQPIAYVVGVADRLAQGDLAAAIQPAGNFETMQLLQSMAHMQNNFAGIVRDVKTNADEVANASAQISQGNQDLSNRTEQQASALQQTAATMEQLGSNVRNNADNAQQANKLALGATTVAVKGGEMMGQVVQTMTGINDSAKKIADIIGVIDGIAFQTNILALNAAVEAARAGEQGRGFAVVASEVRNLAQRSAEAAREIKVLISTSVERVDQGTLQVGQAGQTMDEIVGAIRRVAAIVTQISAASAEQSAGVNEVGQAVSQMDQATQQNAALVEESAAAAASLTQQAQQLVDTVAAFRLA